jgi:nucleoside-diphosphate-sugar epimerase
MKILVTGASGFLGSRLIKRLAEAGHNVLAVSRRPASIPMGENPGIQWITADIAQNGLETHEWPDIDVVVHLAGTGWGNGLRLDQSKDEDFFLRDNERTTVRLFQAMAGKSRRFVVASSQVIYGNPDSVTIREDLPLPVPGSAYACSKLNSENWARWFQKRHEAQCTSLRFCGFIDGGGLVDYLIEQAMGNQPIELYSYGRVCRDYLPSSDGIEALVAAIHYQGKPGFLPINIGSGQKVSAHDLATAVCAALSSKSEIRLLETKALQDNFIFCIDRAKVLLGFKPRALLDAVKDYVQIRQKQASKGT